MLWQVEKIVEERSTEQVHTLACKPISNRVREMKPGQVPNERGDLLTVLHNAYYPCVSKDSSPVAGLLDIIKAFIEVAEAGEKKPGVKPSNVRVAIDLIKAKQSSLSVARTWLGSAAGRQMIADAELCTKKTPGDNSGDLLLKKSLESESSILRIIPRHELGCLEDPDYDSQFLVEHVSLAQCAVILRTLLAMLTKLLEAMSKWSPVGLEEQSSTLDAHHTTLLQSMMAVQHRVAHKVHTACSPSLVALQGQDFAGDSHHPVLQKLALDATAIKKDIIGETVTDNYHSVVKAMVVYFKAAKEFNLVEKAQHLETQCKNIMALLDLALAAADLGMIKDLPNFEEAAKEWADPKGEKLPYMQMVLNFVTSSSGVRQCDMSGASRIAQNMHAELSDHAFLVHLERWHATSRVVEIMLTLKQNLCHAECQLEAGSEIEEKRQQISTEPLESLASILFVDPDCISRLGVQVSSCFLKAPSVSLEDAAHERAMAVATLVVSALGRELLPEDLFDGIWDNALADGGSCQKALEFSRLCTCTTSLAFCMSFVLKFCREGSPIVVTIEKDNVQEEEADKRCFVALQSARLMVKHLKAEIAGKARYYPTEKQDELQGILGFCSLAEVAAERLTGALAFSVKTFFAKRSEDMVQSCPNWMPVITNTTLNMAAAKRMLLDGDAIAQVSSGVRKFGFLRAVAEEAFQMLGICFPTANHDMYETGIDNEIHARLTVALKTAVGILDNHSKNPKRNLLISEFLSLVAKQNTAIAKLKTQAKAKEKKTMQLPGSVKAALDKLVISCESEKQAQSGSKRSSGAGGSSSSSVLPPPPGARGHSSSSKPSAKRARKG